MAKVLKITKSDKTIHVVPLTNKAFYQGYIRRLPADKKWTMEVVNESEVVNHPFIDESFVTPLEGATKAKELQKVLSEKDAEIESLKALLAAQNNIDAPKKTAAEVIELIAAATTVEQVQALSKDDDRATVKKAAEKRIDELNA